METYLQKVNIDKEKLSELMDNESWLSAEEALKYGFIDEIIENADIQVVENKVISNNMVFNMAEFKNFNVDKNIKNNGKGSEKMTREEIKNQYLCRNHKRRKRNWYQGRKNKNTGNRGFRV